jgi:hypothetical protein
MLESAKATDIVSTLIVLEMRVESHKEIPDEAVRNMLYYRYMGLEPPPA